MGDMMLYVFIFYGLLGWCIDSGYRSLVDRRWSRGGFSSLPFTPSYGLAAVILLALAPTISPLPAFAELAFLGLLFGVYEYLCGVISVRVNRRRLWDYTNGFLNVHGHTDLLHGAYWAMLSYGTLHWFHPWVLSLIGQ